MLLEKNMLKDDSSNDADLVHDMRIIIIVAQEKYVLGTLETQRSSVNHIVDMINLVMFTIENYSISRDDGTWFRWFGSRDHLDD